MSHRQGDLRHRFAVLMSYFCQYRIRKETVAPLCERSPRHDARAELLHRNMADAILVHDKVISPPVGTYRFVCPVPAYRHLLHTTNALRRIAGEFPESADNCAKFPRKYWGFPVRIVGTDDCIAALACGSKRGHIRHGSRHDHCPDNTKASCFQFPQSVGRSMGIVGVMAQHVR